MTTHLTPQDEQTGTHQDRKGTVDRGLSPSRIAAREPMCQWEEDYLQAASDAVLFKRGDSGPRFWDLLPSVAA